MLLRVPLWPTNCSFRCRQCYSHKYQARKEAPQGLGTRPVYQLCIKIRQHSFGILVFAQGAAGPWASNLSLKWDVSKVH